MEQTRTSDFYQGGFTMSYKPDYSDTKKNTRFANLGFPTSDFQYSHFLCVHRAPVCPLARACLPAQDDGISFPQPPPALRSSASLGLDLSLWCMLLVYSPLFKRSGLSPFPLVLLPHLTSYANFGNKWQTSRSGNSIMKSPIFSPHILDYLGQ